MPKEYINWPTNRDARALQISLGMSDKDIDGKIGPKTISVWEEELALPIMGDKPDDTSNRIDAPLPQVGLHWDGKNGTVQLSLDVDWDVLQAMVKQRQDHPNETFGDSAPFPNRVVFFTGNLYRDDLQNLVRTARRARNAVYGSDE